MGLCHKLESQKPSPCDNLSVNFGGLDGVGFMKTVVNFFETQRLMDGNTNTGCSQGSCIWLTIQMI